ncbi:amino acid adenylation domain-containing protein/thioester reductase-like protein [Paenibacillus sp. DS2015]|uniref:non-ribosomal peptide synthetase family protein n=1 Tax=Paenibacillus sp. DS2015 TaxID=3373917 RepID=UPI003D18FF49
MNTLLMAEHIKTYWLEELKAPLSTFDIYTDFPKHPTVREVQQTTFLLNVDAEKINKFKDRSDMHGWMLSCYIAFLYRMTGEKDLVIGVKDSRGNVLPFRTFCEGNISFQELFTQISDKLEHTYAASLPVSVIEEMVGQSAIVKTIYGVDSMLEDSSLNWSVQEEEGQWVIHIAYHKNLFKESTIRKFARHFQYIVKAAMVTEDISIGSIPMLTEEDVEAYDVLNDTAMELPLAMSVPAMLQSVLSRFPNRIALSSGITRLTYSQLDQLSNQVAHMLLAKGLVKGGFVSIFMERSIEAIIGMLGVLKAGGAYVPLDPEHPDDRNAYIIKDTQSKFIITKDHYTARLDVLLDQHGADDAVFCIDTQLHLYPQDPIDVQIDGDDLAYVIYTSGSTGKPKGVMIAHAGVINLATATMNHLELNEEDVIMQYSTFSFDASVYDIFSSISSGARLHLLSNEQRFSIESFTAAIEEVKATRIGILPTVFFNQLSAYLSDEDAPKHSQIKSLVIGGEALTGESVRVFQKKLNHRPIIVNAYGPTEVTVVTTTHTIDYEVPDQLSNICIGTPISNYEVLIVNENNQLCPLNVMGELLISSIGMAKGYLNQQAKTDEVFVSDPMNPNSGKRYYRSGDMVTLTENGIQYMGRKDLQVKIRGYRIEIGEIEDNLAKLDNIKDVAIIAKEEADGTKILVAFYTSKDGDAIGKHELVQSLSTKVPAYMIPSHFGYLEVMPVSPTGKIDRKQLAVYEVEVVEEENTHYDAPRNELEQEISAAWEKAIKRTRIGIHDDFFEVGGHSLKILEILVILKPKFPNLKINDFFAFPTIAQLAERVLELKSTVVIHDSVIDPSLIQDLEEFPRSFMANTPRVTHEYIYQNILLTGATGYLGSHLLYELLYTTEAVIYCLVRSSGSEDPYKRLTDTMRSYFGSSIVNKMDGRIVAVQGDLEKEQLGIHDTVMAILHDKIDSIIHCAAEVKHFGEPEYFARVNVESTNRLLDIARRKSHIRFHFVSTLGIPEDLASSDQWQTFMDHDTYDYTVSIENVYTNSKLEAEKLVVRTCQEEGVAVTVYRVGNLSCHSRTGAFQSNIDSNAFYRMLKGMLLLKKAPQVSWQVDITPIDYAGQAITALMHHEDTVGKMFHICNPIQIPYEEMIGFFHKYGYDITLLDWTAYEAWVLDSSQPKEQAGLELAMAQLEGDGAKNSIYRYTCPQTSEYLLPSNVTCQEPNEAFFKLMIDHAIAVGYFDKP